MIGLIIAEKEETGNLIKTVKAKTIEFNGKRFYIGSYNEQQVVICFCGVGKANAAATAMNMVINFNVNKIFNIGLCGTSRPDVIPGSIIIASNLEYYDVDMTSLDYALNQLPEEPIQFSVSEHNINLLKTIIEKPIVGTVATGDSFVTLTNVESFPSLANKEIVGIDMEATSIAQICNKTKTEFMCAKLVSDNLTLDKNSKEQYRTSFKEMGKLIEKICLKVIQQSQGEKHE